jgi:class 3 adenylate cyclase
VVEPLCFETTVALPHSALDLWPLVADANRMDRAVGLPPARFRRDPRPEGGEVVTGEYRILGVRTARWREYPFEWQRPFYYSVVREYEIGPVSRFYGGAEMTEHGTGTEIRVFAQFIPRFRLLRPWVRYWLGPTTMRRSRKHYEAIDDFLSGRSLEPLPALAPKPGHIHQAQIDACLLRLSAEQAPSEPTAQLKRTIFEAADEDVAGMRPLELAQRWGTDPYETVHTFLKATVAGLLEMRWEFMCPSCRGVKADAARLRDLQVTGYCTACNLPFGASVDDGIEARFYPTPAVRDLHVGTYCIGSPMNTPHRMAQTTLGPRETRSWSLRFEEGAFVLRSPQSKGIVRITAGDSDGGDRQSIALFADKMTPDMISILADKAVLELENRLDYPATVAVDDERWSTDAMTPSRMLSAPGSDSLFSADALAPGVELAVGRAALLFSDLAGSTALYQRIGEAQAFRLVTEHFSLLREEIERAHGAVVKTIGDAVMASFTDPVNALNAALSIQRRMRDFDTCGAADPGSMVRIGIHAGPAYLVTLNDRIDYFGTTVNIAARSQREARGGEIVVTDAVLTDASDQIDLSDVTVEPFDVTLQGFHRPTRLHRLRPARATSTPARSADDPS